MTTTHRELPAASAWSAVAALAERELVRFFRQRNRVFGALVQPIIFWLLFSEGLKPAQLDYAHFFPGTLAMILLFTAIFATISIIEDRNEGFLQSVLVSPAPRWAMVTGKVLGGATIALLQGLLFLGLGWLTLDIDISFGDLCGAVTMMAAIAVALTGLGFTIAWRMESTHGFHAVMSVFLLPMWLLSGAFFPSGGAGWMSWIVRVNPLTYGVAGLRRYLQLGGEAAAEIVASPPLWACWCVTLGFAALTLTSSWRIAGTRTAGDSI